MIMKKIALLFAVLGLAACKSGAPVETEYVDTYSEYTDVVECANDGVSDVAFSMPRGNDLRLETDHHVIQIDGAPNTKYTYYVWTGGRTYDQEPDLIVDDGVAAVLVEE